MVSNWRFRDFVIDVNGKLGVHGYFGGRQLGNLMHGYAKLKPSIDKHNSCVSSDRDRVPDLNGQGYDSIARILRDRGSWRDCQTVSNAGWAMAKMNVRHSDFWDVVNEMGEGICRRGSSQAISNLMWSSSSLNVEVPSMVGELRRRPKDFVVGASAQGISNVCISLARMKYDDVGGFFDAVDERGEWLVEEGVRQGNRQCVANVAWSMVKVGHGCSGLLSAISRNGSGIVGHRGSGDLTRMDCQALGSIAWSVARMRCPAGSFFAAINRRCDEVVEKGNGQAIASIAWAYARLEGLFNVKYKHGVRSVDFFRRVDDSCEEIFDGKLRHDKVISNLAWSCGDLGYEMPNLARVIVEKIGSVDLSSSESSSDSSHSGVKCLANVACFLAKSGIKSPKFHAVLSDNVEMITEEGTINDLAIIAWSICVLGTCEDYEGLLRACWSALLERANDSVSSGSTIDKLVLHQMLHVLVVSDHYLDETLQGVSGEVRRGILAGLKDADILQSKAQNEILG